MSIRKLRALHDGGRFEEELKALPEELKARVFEVLRGLRIAERLPGDDDVDEIIPPVRRAGWRRAVPQTALWVVPVHGGPWQSADELRGRLAA